MEKEGEPRQEVFDDPMLGLCVLFLYLLQFLNSEINNCQC